MISVFVPCETCGKIGDTNLVTGQCSDCRHFTDFPRPFERRVRALASTHVEFGNALIKHAPLVTFRPSLDDRLYARKRRIDEAVLAEMLARKQARKRAAAIRVNCNWVIRARRARTRAKERWTALHAHVRATSSWSVGVKAQADQWLIKHDRADWMDAKRQRTHYL